MAGRSRSGFGNDRRAYRCPLSFNFTQFAQPTYNVMFVPIGTANGSYQYTFAYGYLGNKLYVKK